VLNSFFTPLLLVPIHSWCVILLSMNGPYYSTPMEKSLLVIRNTKKGNVRRIFLTLARFGTGHGAARSRLLVLEKHFLST
jgi:hypothetical protein